MHVDKLDKMSKPGDIKKLAQTVEFELEKNVDQPSQLNLAQ